jgi:predicted RND superfamily exporter protein
MHRMTEIALRRPWLTIALAAGVSVFAVVTAARAPASSGAHALIGPDHPSVVHLESFLAEFGGGYPFVIAWSCEAPQDPCTSAFDEASLLMAHQVGSLLNESSLVSRISSPALTPIVLSSPDGMVVYRFVKDGKAQPTHEAIEAAKSDPMWVRGLISADARVGAIVIESADTTPATQVSLVAEVEAAIESHRLRGFRFFMSGNPFFHVASQREALAEAALIGVATGAVIALCFFTLMRSWQSVVGVMVSVGLASGWGLGLIAILGWPWDPLTSAAPTLILVIGSADATHYLTSYWRQRSLDTPRSQALLAAARGTIAPCAMTTATSIAGLVSFVGTESVGFAHFGAVTAAGVAASLLMTFTVLPAVLTCLPDTRRHALAESQRWDGIVSRLIEFPISHKWWVLAGSIVAGVIGIAGLSRLTTDAHPLSYWRDGHPTRDAIEFVSHRLMSIEGVELRIELSEAIEEGDSLRSLYAFEHDLRTIPGVRTARSPLTLIEQSARALGLSNLTRANLGEVLMLLALDGSAAIDQWISLDHRVVRVSIASEPMGVRARDQLLDRINSVVNGLPSGWSVRVTGPSVLQRAIDRVVRDSALQAFSGTSLIVAVLIMLFLRSAKWGALAMVPNVLPMVVLFGLMGFLGVALDAGSALVAPIAIGIAVDDTIHFLHAFRLHRELGLDSVSAARKAGQHVGRAIVTTSMTLSAGFLAMLVSRFQSMANIGLLSAAAIVAAFVAELLVLPALISIFSAWQAFLLQRRNQAAS